MERARTMWMAEEVSEKEVKGRGGEFPAGQRELTYVIQCCYVLVMCKCICLCVLCGQGVECLCQSANGTTTITIEKNLNLHFAQIVRVSLVPSATALRENVRRGIIKAVQQRPVEFRF